ncbi:thioredoxin [Gynuella sunshinyii]|uniref:Thioredoxin n=1 Tax=Gynuella sunshinyii YC6258 TaxID=1445510 RepID=A0A0C5VS47_9GAMM|nr:thioredoxin [Gynuella sunshinyii]AJQ93094.1 thioredoxin domain-containing protein [Gynuella sunshinyii YC6258]
MAKVEILETGTFPSIVEQSQGLTLVDFYADWCGPCKMVAPVLDALKEDYEGQINIVKVNADNEPEILNRFGVRGIPTLMMFRDGQPVDVTVGAQPASALRSMIDKHIAAEVSV